jgi:hypothetical protein
MGGIPVALQARLHRAILPQSVPTPIPEAVHAAPRRGSAIHLSVRRPEQYGGLSVQGRSARLSTAESRVLEVSGTSARGYESPVEASKGASAMRSRSGYYERSMREWAPRRSAGDRLGRSPQRWHHGSPTDARPGGGRSKSHARKLDIIRHNDYLIPIFGNCGLQPLRPLERAVLLL